MPLIHMMFCVQSRDMKYIAWMLLSSSSSLYYYSMQMKKTLNSNQLIVMKIAKTTRRFDVLCFLCNNLMYDTTAWKMPLSLQVDGDILLYSLIHSTYTIRLCRLASPPAECKRMYIVPIT